jgi:hypothetical protein
MRAACVAGREAFLAGRIPRRLYATASSPDEGRIAKPADGSTAKPADGVTAKPADGTTAKPADTLATGRK